MIKLSRKTAEHELARVVGISRAQLRKAGLDDLKQKTIGRAATACRLYFPPSQLSAEQRWLFRTSWEDAVHNGRLRTLCDLLRSCAEERRTPSEMLDLLQQANWLREQTGEAARKVDFLSLVHAHAIQQAARSFGAAAEIAFVRQCAQMRATVAPIVAVDSEASRTDYDIKIPRFLRPHRLVGAWSFAEVKMVQMPPRGSLPSMDTQKSFYKAIEKAKGQIAASIAGLPGRVRPTPLVTCYWWSGWREAVSVALRLDGRRPFQKSRSPQHDLMTHMVEEVRRRQDGAIRVLFGFIDRTSLDPVGDLLPIIS